MHKVLQAISAIATSLVIAVSATGSVYACAHGNKGTLKVHEQGTPIGTENNDPKVCVFNLEGFSFKAGQTGFVEFTVQGGDSPRGVAAGPYDFGPTNANGYYASQYFKLQPGHYKATLYGKELPNGRLKDEKAKSKVFKVMCAIAAAPTTKPIVPFHPVKVVSNKGHVLGASTTKTVKPAIGSELTDTGAPVALTSLLAVTLMAGAIGLVIYKRPNIRYIEQICL